MITLYRNARLIDAQQDCLGAVAVEDGKIRYAGPREPRFACGQIIDVEGRAILPGFIDLHCHLRDPGYPAKETMETGMRAALKGGFTTLVAMANTAPVISTPELVEANQRKAEELRLCRLVQAAAAGQELEDQTPTDYAALSKVTKVLTNDGKTIFSDEFMKNLLIKSREYGFLISTHCQPERQTVARDLALLERVGGNLHIGHISHRETAALIREAKARGLRLTCEVTPHHLIGHDSDYRVNPPLRSREDNLALVEAIKDGTADCLATDHAPHTPEDKQKGMAGISNIEYAAGIYLNVFLEHGIPLTRFSQMISQTPARLLGRNAGLLQEGMDADLVMMDLSISGCVRREDMISRSRNTPFEGAPIRGRMLKTIVGGETRYDYGQART